MVVARLTGVPYRQNDLVMDAANGRILIRSTSASDLTIDEDKYVQLICKPVRRMILGILDDPKHLLSQHPRYVNAKNVNDNDNENLKQGNMVLYARQQVRMACQMYKVKELRCRVKSVVRLSKTEVVAELEKVDDMAEMYGWGSRRK